MTAVVNAVGPPNSTVRPDLVPVYNATCWVHFSTALTAEVLGFRVVDGVALL